MLTARETQVFRAYEEAALAGRPSPTMRELAEIADLPSASNAHRVVGQLVSKGFLRRMRYRTRAVEIDPRRSATLAGIIAAARAVTAEPGNPDAMGRLRAALEMGAEHE
ncbi:LexA family protein [Rhodospirillum sp. A1_3_36]|uniref:LexA family protein n=1 Tax=Rhodospirillum sp. A1_3_36 TaxID=3391666 RepID=UPI0039A51071